MSLFGELWSIATNYRLTETKPKQNAHSFNKIRFEKMIGIYKITNPNGLMYIGKSVDIQRRWKSYYSLNCKDQLALYNSIKKYGVKNHSFEIIEECTLLELPYREIFYIELYNSYKVGLNSARPYFLREKKAEIISNKISIKYDLKWQFKNATHYKMTPCRKIVNTRTGRILKCVLNGGSIGWWIGDKFVVKSKVNEFVELIPTQRPPIYGLYKNN